MCIFPWQLENIGTDGTLLFCGLLFVMRIQHETKGRVLERLEHTPLTRRYQFPQQLHYGRGQEK